ncbi:MAG: hypothetical protein JJE13_03820 [Thermoleophilia bacterium]|nr:hypothetical protein [Thermoleophilia bacterium]
MNSGRGDVPRPPKDWWERQVNLVAEVQFYLRFQLRNTLKSQTFAGHDSLRPFVGDADHYLEYWEQQLGQRFFDMGTFLRLATTVEMLLRDYYRVGMGLSSTTRIDVQRGTFQRVFPWSENNLMECFRRDIVLDLDENPAIGRIRLLVAHRHLYAHSSGLISDIYISNIKRLTGIDLTEDPGLVGYPDKDSFYFTPLDELDAFVEDVRRFFRFFPTA